MPVQLGIRVVRGPNWKWNNEDGGEGHVGTVIGINESDKTVVVMWDCGNHVCGYRAGYQGLYDLRVLENGNLGMIHSRKYCYYSCPFEIYGIRWTCCVCPDVNLCTQCYMSDKHDLSHKFLRYETPSSLWIEIPKRLNAVRLQMKGIFKGAEVIRAIDWSRDDEDGGKGKPGRVIAVEKCSGGYFVRVAWTDGLTYMYQLGCDGKVNLKYSKCAIGGNYYRDHLPLLSFTTKSDFAGPVSPNTPKVPNPFSDDKFHQDFKALFLNKESCDVVFRVNDIVIKAHQLILTARSQVFCTMLEHDMMEKNNGVVNITDCDPECFQQFILFLYCGKLEELSRENVCNLYFIADKYHAEDMKATCLEFMLSNFNTESFCDYITLALRHNDIKLLKYAKKFFSRNAMDVVTSTKWKTFIQENPSVGNDLFVYELRKRKV